MRGKKKGPPRGQGGSQIFFFCDLKLHDPRTTPSGRKVCGTEEERKKKINTKYSGHFISQQRPRAAHALRSDQNNHKNSGHFVPLQCLRAVHALRSDQFFFTPTLIFCDLKPLLGEKYVAEKNNPENSDHFVPLQCLRAVHALRSDQNNPKNSGHFVLQQCLRAAHALRSDQHLSTDEPGCLPCVTIKLKTPMFYILKISIEVWRFWIYDGILTFTRPPTGTPMIIKSLSDYEENTICPKCLSPNLHMLIQ